MVSFRDRLLSNNPWRAVLLAVVLLVVGELLLAWQYRNLEEGRLSDIEQKLEEQEKTIEQRAAVDALEEFLEARVTQDERKIVRYVTEGVMLQRTRGNFELYGVQDYEIKRRDQVAEGIFRFQVSVSRERVQQIEFIEVKKILDRYYINSVELAG